MSRRIFLAGTSQQGDGEVVYDRGVYVLQHDAPFIIRNHMHEKLMTDQFMLLNGVAEHFIVEHGVATAKDILFAIRRDFFLAMGWKVCPTCDATRINVIESDEGDETVREICGTCQYRGYVPLTAEEEAEIDIMKEYEEAVKP